MAYRMSVIPMTLTDFSKVKPSNLFRIWFFIQLCSSWQNFNWRSASRGHCV